MYSSYSLCKCLISFYILAIQLLICSVSSLNITNEYLNHKCRVNQGKYQPGSKYEKDLNSLIRFVADDTRQGFVHSSNTEGRNSTTIIFQCRGDCYDTAVAGFRKRCPRNKGGIIWYDQCFLDISMINDQAPRKMNYKNAFSMHNPNNVRGDTKLFNKKTKEFLQQLVVKADKTGPDGVEFLYYAAAEERIGTQKVYAMVQCAKDVADCQPCLEWSINQLSKCCDGKKGARVLGTSCNLRYELYPFLRT
ncbi:PREDICTED: cysteine-rich repeat secretory protein 34-like [Camelina sativa]|uniref:Cysteine-rich repeat secretory protein 34-like n=1 Tax=Camelina sativa TaxID=90675 RepID=A0ABM0Z5U9_CAMSA|nr:PREDICTED: cysteine-rich repeat secretory protein 34-like [Camelina sativa]